MATKTKISDRQMHIVFVKKLMASLSLLLFLVVTIFGIISENRLITIVYRSAWVLMIVLLVQVVVVRIFSTYEEMNQGG